MGFAWYPWGGVEAGIDGTIEIRDAITGEDANSIIQVQSNATANPFQAETERTFEFRCAERVSRFCLATLSGADVFLSGSPQEQPGSVMAQRQVAA